MKEIKKFLALLRLAKKSKEPKLVLSYDNAEKLAVEIEKVLKSLGELEEKCDKGREEVIETQEKTDDEIIIVNMIGEKF